MTIPNNYFKEKYNLTGKDWINRIDPEDKKAIIHSLNQKNGYGHLGGKARAETGKRDSNGRFK